MTFESLFANPKGRTPRGPFVGALIVLFAAVAFYHFLVHAGRNEEWVLVTLLYPGAVLHARRLQDMGKSGWLVLAPLALIAVAVGMHMAGRNDQVQSYVSIAAAVVSAGFILWGLLGKGQAEANRFGEAVAA